MNNQLLEKANQKGVRGGFPPHPPRLLELFSGTHSVGKIAKEKGYEVLSLDIDGNADINMNIMDWDYKQYPEGYFDYIWSSFPCEDFSIMKTMWIGKRLKKFGDREVNMESIIEYERENAVPLIRKSEEIIDYFKPKYYFMENPATGRAKHYINKPSFVVDYCAYGHPIKKPTQIWTNKTDFIPRRCNCKNKHLGFKNMPRGKKKSNRYMIPPDLLRDLI